MALANPSGCCEVDTECCPTLPEQLKATFTNELDCPKLDAFEMTLVSDGQAWKGEKQCPNSSETVKLTLQCLPFGSPGDCVDLLLDYDLGCGMSNTGIQPDPAACSCGPPVSIEYTISPDGAIDCDCCEELPLSPILKITLTELQ